jgi:hypothetical protein
MMLDVFRIFFLEYVNCFKLQILESDNLATKNIYYVSQLTDWAILVRIKKL